MRGVTRTHRFSLLPLLAAAVALGAVDLARPSLAEHAGPSHTASPAPAPAMPVVRYDQSCARTAQTQMAMDQCVGTQLREVTAQLDRALRQQEQGADGATVRTINAVQASFHTYEHRECLVAASGEVGGSIYPMMVGLCHLRLTVQRLQEVKEDAFGVSGGHG